MLPPNTKSVVASLHPAFAVPSRGGRVFLPSIHTAISRAVKWSEGRGVLRRPSPILHPTMQDIVRICNESKGRVTLDIETAWGDPSQIFMCGIASDKECATMPWEEPFISMVGAVLADPGMIKVGHNFSYDLGGFRAWGLEAQGYLFDTINASALVWPPPSRKKRSEGKGDVKWLALPLCVLRCVDGIANWKIPRSPETIAFYNAAWPGVLPEDREALYCALDCAYTHILAAALDVLLDRHGLRDLHDNIVVPAAKALFDMGSVGLPLDLAKRDELRAEIVSTIEDRSAKVAAAAQPYHEARLARIQSRLDSLIKDLNTLPGGMAPCPAPKHADYVGLTKRGKCPECSVIYAKRRDEVVNLRARIAKGKTRLKQVGPVFKDSSSDHWRNLLFGKLALGLKPISMTEKTKVPRVKDDDLERLFIKHPTIELLRWRVELQHARNSYNPATGKGKLSVEPDADGCVRYVHSLTRTNTGRVGSGDDDSDDDKIRRSRGGNFQNWTDHLRRIFVAAPGEVIVQADWSQAEMRVNAWQAKDTLLLDAFRKGIDIHGTNGVNIARALGYPHVNLGNVRTETFMFEGEMKPFRLAGKKCGLAWIYGMGDRTMARLVGLKEAQCASMREGFFNQWNGLARYQGEVFDRASKDKVLVTEFGRRFVFHDFRRDDVKGWVIADKEMALAAPTQSAVGDMVKAVLPAAAAIPHARLVNTVHDSLVWRVDKDHVEDVVSKVRSLMERDWPELGEIPGFGIFRCPVDIAIGQNCGKYGPDNPFGLREI